MNASSVVESVIGEIAEKTEQRRREREHEFRRLVADVEAGKAVKPDRAESVLSAAGKSVEELRAGVCAYHDRRLLYAKVEHAKTLAGQRADLERRMAKVEQAYREAYERYDRDGLPLANELALIDAAERDATSARQNLIDRCPYPELVADYRAACAATGAARDRLRLLRTQSEARPDGVKLASEAEGLLAERRVGYTTMLAGDPDATAAQAAQILKLADDADRLLPQAAADVKSMEAAEADAAARLLTP